MMFQLSMFFLSFSPLWLSIVFIDAKNLICGTAYPWTERISIACIVLGVIISLPIMVKRLKGNHAQNKKQVEIKTAKEEKFLIAEFLMAYIFPLFAFDFTQWDGVALFLIFFLIFCWQCIRHSYLCVNVILDWMHYRGYECEMEDKTIIKVLSRRNLLAEKKLCYTAINNDYVLDIM